MTSNDYQILFGLISSIAGLLLLRMGLSSSSSYNLHYLIVLTLGIGLMLPDVGAALAFVVGVFLIHFSLSCLMVSVIAMNAFFLNMMKEKDYKSARALTLASGLAFGWFVTLASFGALLISLCYMHFGKIVPLIPQEYQLLTIIVITAEILLVYGLIMLLIKPFDKKGRTA